MPDVINADALRGHVAVVTGVSRRAGIGFAIASRLAGHGAAVLVQSWTPHDEAQPWGGDPGGMVDVLRALRHSGGPVEHLEADFTNPDAPAEVLRTAATTLGPVDILVANHARSSAQVLEELTADELDASFAVNARATLLLVKEFAARLVDRPGRVVLLTSGQHRDPMPGELPYAASKGALEQTTLSLAAHLAGRSITVNAVNPGPTDTGWASPDLHAEIERGFPQHRWGTPDDVARLITWLVSDDAGWVTGQVIDSTGGWRPTQAAMT